MLKFCTFYYKLYAIKKKIGFFKETRKLGIRERKMFFFKKKKKKIMAIIKNMD